MIVHPQPASGPAVVRVPRKSGGSIRCVCGHRRDEHCGASPCPHDKRDKYGRRLQFDHCMVCGCPFFTGPKKANLTTECANPGCQHPKKDHCWSIPRRLGGQGPHAHHFWLGAWWYQCTTDHCTVGHYREGRTERCDCANFVDPYAKPKKLKQSKTAAPPAKTRAEILVELVKEVPDLSLAEMAEASSRSERWCRKVLKAAGIAVPKAPRRARATATEGEQTQ